MLRLIALILSRQQPSLNRHIDCAAMSVRNTAVRWVKQLKIICRWPEPKPATASI